MRKSPALFEKLAEIAHQGWADWQSYMHSKGIKNEDGSLTIPTFFIEQWERQIKTLYFELSEKEKDSDRDQVKRYWDLLE